MNKGCTSGFIVPGKMNMIYDGQYGSTGKGLIAARIATDNHIDVTCTRLSPNAGHTFYIGDKKCVTKMLPVSGIINPNTSIFIGFGSVIDVDCLFREIKQFNIDPMRIVIHPRAAVVTDADKRKEQEQDGVVTISSTQSGSGAARASKIMRNNPLAFRTPSLEQFIGDAPLKHMLDHGASVFVETSQGYDLSLNVGFSYPYCTSTDVTPSAILADFNMHPRYMGNSIMAVRTYPIRVGNTTDEHGAEIGYSGPVWSDSEELSWEELGQKPELTTVTKRTRRVFTFSLEQYRQAVYNLEPSHVFLNFINYLRPEDSELITEISKIRIPDYVGYGPKIEDVKITNTIRNTWGK